MMRAEIKTALRMRFPLPFRGNVAAVLPHGKLTIPL
jgi:hypothetical protein